MLLDALAFSQFAPAAGVTSFSASRWSCGGVSMGHAQFGDQGRRGTSSSSSLLPLALP